MKPSLPNGIKTRKFKTRWKIETRKGITKDENQDRQDKTGLPGNRWKQVGNQVDEEARWKLVKPEWEFIKEKKT